MNTSSIDPSPFCIATGGVRIRVLAHPGARRDAIEGLHAQADGGTALRVAVRAAPEDGKANAAIAALLAREWRVPKHSLRLVSGAAAPWRICRKSFHLSGEPKALLAQLDSWLRQRAEPS